MALSLRYTNTVRGAMTFTGNTLGLAQRSGFLEPGTQHSIGAFITTDSTQRVDDFPIIPDGGTTTDYENNSSSAILSIPAGAQVLYAELIWSGTMKSRDEDVTLLTNNSITFTDALNIEHPITPITGNKFTGEGTNTTEYYVQYVPVTQFVANAGAGTYTVGSIPAILDPNISSTSTTGFAGWTLAVIYADSTMPIRNMTLRVGGNIVTNTDSSDVLIQVSGFVTPTIPSFNARILLSAGEGDLQLSGDEARFAPTQAGVDLISSRLSGPRNQATNFFSSQICNDTGNLNTLGTYGNLNNTPPSTLVSGARQGWDITNVDASTKMNTNQTSAWLRLTTNQDSYCVNAVGIQIDMNETRLSLTKSANTTQAVTGQTIQYTLTVSNTGLINANNVVVRDPLTAGLNFVPGSVRVNGSSTGYELANIQTTGVNIGTVVPTTGSNLPVTITFDAVLNGINGVTAYTNTSLVSYNFVPGIGLNPVPDTQFSAPWTVTLQNPDVTIEKSVNYPSAVDGDTLTYTIRVTNNSVFPITGASIVDDFPINLQPVGGAPGGIVTVPIGTLAAGASTIVTIQAAIVNSQNINFVNNNNVKLDYSFGEILFEEDFIGDVITTINKPFISVIKTQQPDTLPSNTGELVTYRISIQNTGSIELSQVTLNDLLPVGLEVVSGSLSVTPNTVVYTGDNPVTGITFTNPFAVASAPVIVAFQARVTNVANTPFINQANVTYRYASRTQGTLTGTQLSNPVTLVLISQPLTTTKSGSMGTTVFGEEVTFTVLVRNPGTRIARNIVITDMIPAGMVYVSGPVYSLGTLAVYNTVGTPVVTAVTASLSELPPGGFTEFTFVAASNSTISETFVNSATGAYVYYLIENDPTTSTPGTTASNEVVVSNLPSNIDVELDKSFIKDNLNVRQIFVGDTAFVKLVINNQSSLTISNMVVKDQLDSDLIAGQITVTNSNGIAIPFTGNNLISGITIATPLPGNNAAPGPYTILVPITVSETAKEFITNQATMDFVYGTGSTATAISNTVDLFTYDPAIEISKSVQPDYVFQGGTVTYTLVVTNPSNINLPVTVSDQIPSGMELVGDITVDGASVGNNLSLIPLGIINRFGEEKTVTYTLRAIDFTTCPKNNTATATATAILPFIQYAQVITTRTVTALDTESVICSVENVTIDKTVDKEQAQTGEILTYTAIVRNLSSGQLLTALLTDILPPGAELIPDSVFPAPIPGESILTGMNIGPIGIGGSRTIIFQVRTDQVTDDLLQNRATVSYTLQPYPGSTTSVTGTFIPFDDAFTAIIDPSIEIAKAVDKEYVTLNETFNYTVTVNNTGETALTNIILKDLIPDGLTYGGTVQVVDVPAGTTTFIQGNLEVGILVKQTIQPGTGITITIPVTVSSLTNLTFVNNAEITYSYTINSVSGTQTVTETTNDVTNYAYQIMVSGTKSVSPAIVVTGNIVTYTISINNMSTIPITNVVVTDIIPAGMLLNGTTTTIINSGIISILDQAITDGVTIPLIAANSTAQLVFTTTVQSVPPTIFTNRASFDYNYQISETEPVIPVDDQAIPPTNVIGVSDQLTVSKIVTPAVAEANQILTYTVFVTNTGQIPVQSVKLTDILPSEVTYQTGTLRVDGEIPASEDFILGIPLPDLLIGDSTTITFNVKLTGGTPGDTVDNQSIIVYEYVVVESGTIYSGSSDSDIATFLITGSSLVLDKSTTSTYVKQGDLVPYTITLTNTGSAVLNQVMFRDAVPAGMNLYNNQVSVGGNVQSNVDMFNGLPVGSIAPGNSVNITYQLQVVDISRAVYTNGAIASFVSENNISGNSNPDTTTVNSIPVCVTITPDRPWVCAGQCMRYQIVIRNLSSNQISNLSLSNVVLNGVTVYPNSIYLNNTIPLYRLNGVALPVLLPNNCSCENDLTITFTAQAGICAAGTQATANVILTYADNQNFSQIVSNTSNTPIVQCNYDPNSNGGYYNNQCGCRNDDWNRYNSCRYRR